VDVRQVARELAHQDPVRRRAAVAALGGLADLWAYHHLKTLRKNDPAAAVRHEADRAFRRCEDGLIKRILRRIPEFAHTSGQAFRLVERSLRSVDGRVRCAAVRAAAMAGNVGFVSPILEMARQDLDERVVITCLKALGMMGARREAIELVRFAGHQSPAVRTAAVLSLAMMARGYAWVLLVRLAASGGGHVGGEALFFLALLGEKTLLRLLGYMVASAETAIAAPALEVAARMGTAGGRELVERCADHGDERIRWRACDLLGRPRPVAAVAPTPAPSVSSTTRAVARLETSQQVNALGGFDSLLEVEAIPDSVVETGGLPAVDEPSAVAAAKGGEDDDEVLQRARREVLTQSYHLPQPALVRDSSLDDGLRAVALAGACALGGLCAYAFVVGLMATPLLLLVNALGTAGGPAPVLVGSSVLSLATVFWCLVPRRDRWYGTPLPEGRQTKLHRALEGALTRCGLADGLPPPMLEPGPILAVVDVSHVPFLPLGGRRRLMLGALLLPHLSAQELKVLVARAAAERSFEQGPTARYLRRVHEDFVALRRAYGCRDGLGRWVNPVSWALRAGHGAFLAVRARCFRRVGLLADQTVAATFGANVAVDAIVQAEVMTRVTGELVTTLLDDRRAMGVRPVNVYGELQSAYEHVLDGRRSSQKARLLAASTAPRDPVTALKDRVDAISHGLPRRTRANREAWSLFDGRPELERKLSSVIWDRARW